MYNIEERIKILEARKQVRKRALEKLSEAQNNSDKITNVDIKKDEDHNTISVTVQYRIKVNGSVVLNTFSFYVISGFQPIDFKAILTSSQINMGSSNYVDIEFLASNACYENGLSTVTANGGSLMTLLSVNTTKLTKES